MITSDYKCVVIGGEKDNSNTEGGDAHNNIQTIEEVTMMTIRIDYKYVVKEETENRNTERGDVNSNAQQDEEYVTEREQYATEEKGYISNIEGRKANSNQKNRDYVDEESTRVKLKKLRRIFAIIVAAIGIIKILIAYFPVERIGEWLNPLEGLLNLLLSLI